LSKYTISEVIDAENLKVSSDETTTQNEICFHVKLKFVCNRFVG